MYDALASLLNNPLSYEKIFAPTVMHDIVSYKANEKILEQGKKYDYIGFIKSGNVRVILNEDVEGLDSIHTVIAELSHNHVIGEFELFSDAPASADVLAISDTDIIQINIRSLRSFLESEPEVGYRVLYDILESHVKNLQSSNKIVLHLLKSAIDFQKKLHQMLRQGKNLPY